MCQTLIGALYQICWKITELTEKHLNFRKASLYNRENICYMVRFGKENLILLCIEKSEAFENAHCVHICLRECVFRDLYGFFVWISLRKLTEAYNLILQN